MYNYAAIPCQGFGNIAGYAPARLEQSEITAELDEIHALFTRSDQTNTSGISLDFLGQFIWSVEAEKLCSNALQTEIWPKYITRVKRKVASRLNDQNDLKLPLVLLRLKSSNRILYTRILTNALWCGIFQPQNRCRRSKRYSNACPDFYI